MLSKHSVPRWLRVPGLWGTGSAGLWKGALLPSSPRLDLKQASLFPANPENVMVGRALGQGSWATVLLGHTPGLLGDEAKPHPLSSVTRRPHLPGQVPAVHVRALCREQGSKYSMRDTQSHPPLEMKG